MNDFGGNVGGPIALPGLDGGKKAFFFTNFDELRQASELSRRRTILTPSARTGLFSYTSGGAVREVNVLALAAQNGQLASPDPTIARLLAEIAAATTTTGSTAPNADNNTSTYTWNSPDDLLRRHWTSRVDLALGPEHRLSGIYNFNKYARVPDTLTSRDPRFPGLPAYGSNTSFRNSATTTLRSTLSSSARERGHVRRVLGLERRRPRAGAGGVCESRGPQSDTCRGKRWRHVRRPRASEPRRGDRCKHEWQPFSLEPEPPLEPRRQAELAARAAWAAARRGADGHQSPAARPAGRASRELRRPDDRRPGRWVVHHDEFSRRLDRKPHGRGGFSTAC